MKITLNDELEQTVRYLSTKTKYTPEQIISLSIQLYERIYQRTVQYPRDVALLADRNAVIYGQFEHIHRNFFIKP